jgi:hypothetical protein
MMVKQHANRSSNSPFRHAPKAILALLSAGLVATAPGCSGVALMAAGEDVRLGVARLTVSNAGAIASRINSDPTCGFASEAAMATATVQGEPGEQGSITMTAECDWDWNPATEISSGNCLGEGGQVAGGRLSVRATQTRFGLVTGEEDAPIIPAGSESVVIDIEVAYEDFVVQGESGRAANYLFWNDVGTMSFSVQPRLAVSTDPGAPGICAAVTGNSWLKNIRFSDAQMTLVTSSFPQPISLSVNDLNIESAYNGEWSGGFENQIFGSITVEGQVQDFTAGVPLVPEEAEDDAIPVYDPQAFQDSWACEPEGFGTDPEVRMVAIDEATGKPNYNCVSEVPPARLGDGAARLSVSTFADVVQLIQRDTNCGFASDAVLDSATVEETGGGRGIVTYNVTECAMAFPLDTVVATSCAGVDTKVSGRATVTGTFALEGRLTGDRLTPVLPLSPDAATIDLTNISFDNFRVRSDRPEFMTFKSGSFAGTLKPKLAIGESSGACSVPTTNVKMENLRYLGATEVTLAAPQGVFDAEITAGSFRAINGEYDDEVDALSGSITIGGEEVIVPGEGEHPGLVPGFDLAAHRESLSCIDDLQFPVKYDGCTDIEAELISGAARLSVAHLGALASLMQADDNCGFSAPSVIDAVQTEGNLGERGGRATWTVSDCVMAFPEPTVVATDCNGNETVIQGSVTASGTFSLAGWLAAPDNKEQPIVPDTWQPATLNVSFDLDNLSVRSGLDQYLTAQSGVLSGVVRPQTAIDTETGACSIATSNAEISDVSWTPGSELIVNSGEFAIHVGVDGADLTATNGRLNGNENYLAGTLTIGGEDYAVPFGPNEPAPNILVPDFSLDDHNNSFACEPGMQMPSSSDECSFFKVIGEGAARLVVQTMGEATSFVNAEPNCGFGRGTGLIPGDIVTGSTATPEQPAEGDQCNLFFTTDTLLEDYPEGCMMATDASDPPTENCVGDQTFRNGNLWVKADRVVGGSYVPAPFGIHNINSNDHNEVHVIMREVNFEDFSMWSLSADGEEGPGELVMHNGTGTGDVFPILAGTGGDINQKQGPTPVAFLKGIQYSGDVTLVAQGRTFKFTIDSMEVDAFNGRWVGDNNWNDAPIYDYGPMSVFSSGGPYENFIDGSITIDGETIDMDMQGLVPGFDAATFKAGYCPCAIQADEIAECVPDGLP